MTPNFAFTPARMLATFDEFLVQRSLALLLHIRNAGYGALLYIVVDAITKTSSSSSCLFQLTKAKITQVYIPCNKVLSKQPSAAQVSRGEKMHVDSLTFGGYKQHAKKTTIVASIRCPFTI